MTVIQASSAGVRDMADGSLRITLEFDPRHAKDAYALFGTRGTPVAVAAITQEAAQEMAQNEIIEEYEIDGGVISNIVGKTITQKETIEADKPKGGPLAKLAGMWCNDMHFWAWVLYDSNGTFVCSTPDQAAIYIRSKCKVSSRAEFDSDIEAEKQFQEKIRIPYMEWLQGKK